MICRASRLSASPFFHLTYVDSSTGDKSPARPRENDTTLPLPAPDAAFPPRFKPSLPLLKLFPPPLTPLIELGGVFLAGGDRADDGITIPSTCSMTCVANTMVTPAAHSPAHASSTPRRTRGSSISRNSSRHSTGPTTFVAALRRGFTTRGLQRAGHENRGEGGGSKRWAHKRRSGDWQPWTRTDITFGWTGSNNFPLHHWDAGPSQGNHREQVQ